MMARIKAFLDKYTEKFISRKFLVFIISTIGWITGSLTEDNWMSICLAYVGIEGFKDLAVAWKHGIISSTKSLNSKPME